MKSHEPFQSYLLTGQADSANFDSNLFLKYETIVSRNGLSLGYSERDTSSVTRKRPDADASQRLAGAQFFCNKLLSKTNLVFF